MSDSSPHEETKDQTPEAKLRRPRFQLVWLIPIIAAIIAGYLGYRTLMNRGPLLILTFDNASGLQVGQTQLKYKAVALGTVEAIDLAADNGHVVVKVRMNNIGRRFLNSNARFWVVRPRMSLSDITSFETIVSGAYITVDPGKPGGQYEDSFVGLEQPPGVRSDEPGHTYTLTAYKLGAISSGSPIFYRDIVVGEVLGYDIGNGLGPIKISIFIRAPFDNLVRPDSRFWNSSGISFDIKGGVLQLQMQSLQALVLGGITFSLPYMAQSEATSPDNASFHLYASQQQAEAAGFKNQIQIVTYADSDISGLTAGSPVTALGVEVGDVTGVDLQLDTKTGKMRVKISMQLQPERVLSADETSTPEQMLPIFQKFVNNGLRAEISTANYVTGQKEIALTMEPKQAPVKVSLQDGAILLPFKASSLTTTLNNTADITNKIDQIPFQQIGQNLNKLLETANGTLGGPQTTTLIKQLTSTLGSADTTLQNLNQGFGQDSDLQRNLRQILGQTNSTLQSLQALTIYLNQHPQSLLFGRTNR